MRLTSLAFCALLAFSPLATADPVRVEILDANGSGIANAVLSQPSATAPAPVEFDWDYVMAQQDRSFTPHVLIVPAGSRVSFPNRDRFRHHIYSFSKGNKFEIELYGRDETRSMTFETVGIVALGCNIHDEMAGYIHVVETDIVGQSDAAGMLLLPRLSISNELKLWLPSRTREWIEVAAPPDGNKLQLVLGPNGEAPFWRAME